MPRRMINFPVLGGRNSKSPLFHSAMRKICAATIGGSIIGCGGSPASDAANPVEVHPPGEAGALSVPNEAVASTPRVGSTGNAIEYFNRGATNLAIDHQRALFAIAQHLPGTNSSYYACGPYSPSDRPFGLGTELVFQPAYRAPGGDYPTSFGGKIMVSNVAVASVTETRAIVLHVSMVNGTEFDEAWSAGVGTGCAETGRVCIPPLDTCASMSK